MVFQGIKEMSGKKYDAAVFIGRFQPVHFGHLNTIRLALQQCHKLFLVLGSFQSAPSVRNPWSTKQREEMINLCLTKQEKERIVFIPIRDRLYSEFIWLQNITHEVTEKLKEIEPQKSDFSIALIGHNKDTTSYYLKNFSYWNYIETGNFKSLNSTQFRNSFFLEDKPDYSMIPSQVTSWLKKYTKKSSFQYLKKEYEFVTKAKQSNKDSKIEVANCLLLCGNYILLVQRNHSPGRLCLALPGGHLEKNEAPLEGALRELYEETQFSLDKETLKSFAVKNEVFAHPERNPIGPSLAHVFFFRFSKPVCPTVLGGDDAKRAFWLPCDNLNAMENKFFADHFQIIQKMLGRFNENDNQHLS
jgi:bifunctional NMN adenylyltransferase/nudix hydrolase